MFLTFDVNVAFNMSLNCLDWNPLIFSSMEPSNHDTGVGTIPSLKRHAACDECSKLPVASQ